MSAGGEPLQRAEGGEPFSHWIYKANININTKSSSPCISHSTKGMSYSSTDILSRSLRNLYFVSTFFLLPVLLSTSSFLVKEERNQRLARCALGQAVVHTGCTSSAGSPHKCSRVRQVSPGAIGFNFCMEGNAKILDIVNSSRLSIQLWIAIFGCADSGRWCCDAMLTS